MKSSATLLSGAAAPILRGCCCLTRFPYPLTPLTYPSARSPYFSPLTSKQAMENPSMPPVGAWRSHLTQASDSIRRPVFQNFEVGAFYWTNWAPDIVNSGREGQGSDSV